MKTIRRRSVALALGLCLVAAGHAQKTFKISHTLSIPLNPVPNQIQAGWVWSDTATTPAGQNVNSGSVIGNLPFAGTKTATQNDATGQATATSKASLTLAGNLLTAVNEVSGSALAIKPKTTSAVAISTLSFRTGVATPRGQIKWSPFWLIDSLKGSVSQTKDPLVVSMTNLATGAVQTSEFFSANLDLQGADGGELQSSWSAGSLSLGGSAAKDGALDIAMNSPFLTSGTGLLHLKFANGAVTESDDSGVFDGLLPAVGSTSYSLLSIPTSYTMDFDFGGSSTAGFEFGAELGNAGSAVDAVPEPTTFAALGLGAFALARHRRAASR